MCLDRYDLDVVDYLLKQVTLDRFMEACNKAKGLYYLKNPKQQLFDKPVVNYFFQYVDYSQLKILFSDIVWIEGLGDYIKIHLKSSNKPLVTRNTIKVMEDDLPSSKFIHIHKSYIISIDTITAIRKTAYL